MTEKTGAVPAEIQATVVLLCGDLASGSALMDVAGLRAALETSNPGVSVDVVPGLCEHPARLVPQVARRGATRLALGLCSMEHSPVEMQARIRRAGIDPLGVEMVPLGAWCDSSSDPVVKAAALLGGAVARVRAFDGSGPENSRPYFISGDTKISRRSLFTLPPIAYRSVPSIRAARCAAELGCHSCVLVCPTQALKIESRKPSLDKMKCQGCGVCLAACPRDAFRFPGWSWVQMEAQLGALLDSGTMNNGHPALVIACHRASRALEGTATRGTLLPMLVPCLGMVTPAWLLQALAHGATSVALVSCESGCPLGQNTIIGGRVNFCRRLLADLGQDPDRVRVINAAGVTGIADELAKMSSVPPGQESTERLQSPVCLAGLPGAVQAARWFARGGLRTPTVIRHSYSPFGLVKLKGDVCTGCQSCVRSCATGALSMEREGAKRALSYDASLCNGCGVCSEVCPESGSGAIGVERALDLQVASLGRTRLVEFSMATCEACGTEVASESLVSRLRSSLGGKDGSMSDMLGRYCTACRLFSSAGIAHSSVYQPDQVGIS